MLLAPAQRNAVRLREESAPTTGRLTPLEVEVIDLFVQLSQMLGQPRSLAEIYGLLFISARPLALDDFVERLSMSRGSASQGLASLRRLGAVRTVYVPGERRMRYEAVAELRNLGVRFVREQVLPRLDSGQERLRHIGHLVRELPAAERAQVSGRVKLLQSWERNARRFLSVLIKLLAG